MMVLETLMQEGPATALTLGGHRLDGRRIHWTIAGDGLRSLSFSNRIVSVRRQRIERFLVAYHSPRVFVLLVTGRFALPTRIWHPGQVRRGSDREYPTQDMELGRVLGALDRHDVEQRLRTLGYDVVAEAKDLWLHRESSLDSEQITLAVTRPTGQLGRYAITREGVQALDFGTTRDRHMRREAFAAIELIEGPGPSVTVVAKPQPSWLRRCGRAWRDWFARRGTDPFALAAWGTAIDGLDVDQLQHDLRALGYVVQRPAWPSESQVSV